MVKTDIKSSKSMRARAQSDASPSARGSDDETRRDKFRKPGPLRAGMDSGTPKNLPPTPPSESEGYMLSRSRSRSQPATGRGAGMMTPRSSNSSNGSDYAGRGRLNTVKDDEDEERLSTDMRRTRSLATRNRNSDDRPMNRSMSARRDPRSPGRRTDSQDLYDVYDDYYDEKPPLARSNTRRPLNRAMSRSRTTSRARSRDEEEDRFSDDEEGDFEMITPKRPEITKV